MTPQQQWALSDGAVAAAPAGIGFVAFSSQNLPAGNTTVPLPAGIEDGDYLIACIGRPKAAEHSVPAGWTLLKTHYLGIRAHVSGKFYDSETDTGYAVTDGTSFTGGVAMILAFRGVDPGSPEDAATTFAGGASGMPDCPAITTVSNVAAVVAIGFLDNDYLTGVAYPADYTAIGLHGNNNSAGNSSLMAAYRIVESAGAEDPGAYSMGATDGWVGITVALRPT